MTRKIFVLALLAFGPGCAQPARSDDSQPQARRSDHVDSYHGVEVPDPYQWMENMESAETRKWVRGQHEYTRALLKNHPMRGRIEERLRAAADSTRIGGTVLAGDRIFFARFKTGGGMQDVVVSDDIQGQHRILVARSDLPEGRQISTFSPSPDGRYLLWAHAPRGSRWVEVKVRDVESGRDLPESLTGINLRVGGITWHGNSKGFFYDRFEAPKPGEEISQELKPEGIYHHALKTSQDEDELFYKHPRHADRAFGHMASRDGRSFLLVSRKGDLREILHKRLDQDDSAFEKLFETRTAGLSFLGKRKGEFLFQTSHGASLGRIVAVDPKRPQPQHWEEVVPEQEHALVGSVLHGDTILLSLRKDAKPALVLHRLEEGSQKEVDLPRLAAFGVAGRRDGKGQAVLRISNLVDPGSMYLLDVETGRTKLIASSETAHDPDDYATRQVFYESKDGTRVPMILVHPKDYQPNGETPVFMYGYGAGKWAAFPWYQQHLVAWLELGGIYAMPNIRGGGEYGEKWYRDGIKENKQNSFDDFIAAGRWLIEQGYTNSGKLIANGGSASGPLAGAVLVQEPDLWGAVVIEWPFLDMLRFTQFPGGKFWTWTSGDPRDPEDFRRLHSWSPYHNLQEGACYPAAFTLVGENDESTVPAHSYKFQAALQHAQGCDNPVLMRMIWEGGHYRYGASAEARREVWADLLTFCAMAVDM